MGRVTVGLSPVSPSAVATWYKRLLGKSTPDPFLEDFELWDVEASYLPRWLEELLELRSRVDEAIDRYERLCAVASAGAQRACSGGA